MRGWKVQREVQEADKERQRKDNKAKHEIRLRQMNIMTVGKAIPQI